MEQPLYFEIKSVERDDCEFLSKNYDVKTPLGKGAYGKVYETCNKNTINCPYALKVMIFDKTTFEMSGEIDRLGLNYIKNMWKKEVHILEKLNACQLKMKLSFVPKLIDSWFCAEKDKSYFYILMEKLEGNLIDFFKKYGKGKFVKSTVLLALDVLYSNLHHIHNSCKICLNDIKLDNILYKQEGDKFIFMFADTGNSSLEPNNKCIQDDQDRFERTIIMFKDQMKLK